ncbi:MAG TPA: hypothetical protein VK129_01320, partial [Terriglobales bacterium]|nr:hypothetical protein [Terriglobales bacterium]
MAQTTHIERVLPFEEARKIVETAAGSLLRKRTFSSEKIDLLGSAGRVLAEEIVSDRDLPPFNRATRDGYVLLTNDVAGASEGTPAALRVIDEIKAGSPQYGGSLQAGEALEIMTG